MGRKGASTGLKRKPAPKFWPIHRKEFTWVVKPSPGPHDGSNCLPLTIVLRDSLGFAKTRKEARTIVSQGKICIDGQIRRDDGFPVGLADVVSVLDVDKNFRVIPSVKGLVLQPIDKEEAKFKLCRIENKTTAKNGNMQLNLHDGSNILIKSADAKNPQEDVLETIDTVRITLPERQIVESIKMKEKDYAIITGGKNIGKHGNIIQIEEASGKKRRNALVTIEDKKGNRYQTTLNFVFAIGETQPLISLPEAD
ncbi:MAG: 30S ribosomal protein S4e [Candidatus Bathyarchaeia archaeon]